MSTFLLVEKVEEKMKGGDPWMPDSFDMPLCSPKKEVPQNPLGALLHGEPENEVLLLPNPNPRCDVLAHLVLDMVIPCQDPEKALKDFVNTLSQVSGSDPIGVEKEDLYN